MNYLEDMMPPIDWEKCVGDGYLTIRHHFWFGVCSCMAIEQVLMRATKTTGRLTRGRRITHSTLAQRVDAVHLCISILKHWLTFHACSVKHQTNTHYIRIMLSSGRLDRLKMLLIEWVDHIMSPFWVQRPVGISLKLGGFQYNCDNSVTIDSEQMLGPEFGDLKLHNK